MENYYSEADVETKYIYTILLKQIFEIQEENISLHVPVTFQAGHQKQTKEVDVVVSNGKGENILVIDAKAPNVNLEPYFGQIDSYAFSLETPISILTNSNRLIVRVYQGGNKKEVALDETIENLESNSYSELNSLINKAFKKDTLQIKTKPKDYIDKPKITNYRRTFRNIHTKIRSIDKLDPSASFDEFSKVLFIKIINDKLSEENSKDVLTIENIENLGNVSFKTSYINQWFQDKVKEYYPGIFSDNERITLSPKALVTVLDILNNEFDLKESTTDIKGRAFEEFLPSQLRGKGLGQFFTPRPVVDFMVELANISFKDKVLDFASGSGGFLIKAFDIKKRIIQEMPEFVLEGLDKSREELIEEAKTQIFGIDAEPRATRTAKMNMLLWGDGKQIQHGNGLSKFDSDGNEYLAKEFNKNDPNSGVDVILANPPFGAIEEDQDILSNYSLSSLKKTNKGTQRYTSEKTESLFVERAWKLLKPEGQLLIVLPEGIFSNKTSKTRDFILSHFKIDNIIRLPKHSFVMSGVDTINTVILVAYKNNEDRQKEIILSDKSTWISQDQPMTIKFSSVNQIGYEPSGKLINKGFETSDFKTLIDKLEDNDLSECIKDPKEFAELEFADDEKSENWKKPMLKFIKKDFKEVPQRMDPTYYFFHEEAGSILENFTHLPISEKNIVKDKLSDSELEENVERLYKYVSVTKNIKGHIDEIEEKTVDEILAVKSRVQKLKQGDVVFNPYRINTGSIIKIDMRADNLVTSPAYVVIRSEEIDSDYLVQLLKTPFMKYQIEVLASGSVRDNFSSKNLFELKIPNITIEKQKELVSNITNNIRRVYEKKQEIKTELEKVRGKLNDF